MNIKKDREEKEMKSLFCDPKFSRKAWQSVGRAILQNPASKPVIHEDKDGKQTANSEIETYTYTTLCEDMKNLSQEKRKPTELEMIMACQIVKARTDTAAATFVRDTVGAKPVDESKLDATVTNPFEEMSDEELQQLAAIRAGKAKVVALDEPTAEPTIVKPEDNK